MKGLKKYLITLETFEDQGINWRSYTSAIYTVRQDEYNKIHSLLEHEDNGRIVK